MISRRTLIGAAAAGVVARPAFASPQTSKVLKPIPATGEQVPAIGMGTWRTFDVGGDETSRAQRTQVLETFFDMGGTMIDSSPMYGSSQSVVGDALARLDRKDDVFSADKVWIRGGDNGPGQINETRRRWGVERIDLLQVHNLLSWREHLKTLFTMKDEGRLRYVGITSYSGLRYDAIARIMEEYPLDFVQITYNIADREAEQRLLPLAAERGVAVIANRPYREGTLIDYVKRYPLPDIAAEIGAANWAQFLLKFIVAHPALTAAIPATRRVDHMRENMGALSGPLPDVALRRDMIKAFEAL
jgi:diketogulonate reductase-like aldo/keto reductase